MIYLSEVFEEKVEIMNKWFYINGSLFVFAAVLVFTRYHGIHMVIGLFGLGFILYNWTRHAVFSTIRTHTNRQTKIKFAQLSKKLLPIHKWTGSTSLVLILMHAFLVINHYGWTIYQTKMITGLFALLILIFMVGSGWLRWYRTTVKRRYLHWILGFLLFFSALLHIFTT